MLHRLVVAWHSRSPYFRVAWLLRQGVACNGARLSTYFIDRMARASSAAAGTESRSRALLGLLHTVLAPVSRCARFKDQLQLDGEVYSEIADCYTTGSSARHCVAVGDL